jgi:hypothetical protein
MEGVGEVEAAAGQGAAGGRHVCERVPPQRPKGRRAAVEDDAHSIAVLDRPAAAVGADHGDRIAVAGETSRQLLEQALCAAPHLAPVERM